ncbi:Esterase/lipase/thioesterase [Ceratobasidium sp. 428]|nr:Esterase/lipase/thioesterase [Ceratobasidium sp. 428]
MMMLKLTFTLLIFWAGIISTVRAHGYVQNITIGGQFYQGFHPFEDLWASPVPQTVVRKVQDDGPITYNAPELTCNKNGQQGNGLSATVAAGQDVTWVMNRWPDDHHGPVQVYMANCNGDCDTFSGTGAVWFKLSSQGLVDATQFVWATDKLIQAGNSWTQTIPSNIQAGNYLLRLELLALHSAGAPQFYPSCTQVTVTGGGEGGPGLGELVSIPGVYGMGDPAIFGDIWSQPQSWPQVGPNVAAFVSGGSSNPAPVPSAPSSSVAVTTSASDPVPTVSSDPVPTSTSDPVPTSGADPATTTTTTRGVRPTTTKGTSPTTTEEAKGAGRTCRVRKVGIVKKSSYLAKRYSIRPAGKRWWF